MTQGGGALKLKGLLEADRIFMTMYLELIHMGFFKDQQEAAHDKVDQNKR